MRFSFVPPCVCLMGFNRRRRCWNWMQQGSWVDGPSSIQTPALQLCPVLFPSFPFPSGPMTEPLNTHWLTDTQIHTPPYTRIQTEILPPNTHTHKPWSSTCTHRHICFKEICTPLQSTCFEQCRLALNPTCSIIYRIVHILLCRLLTNFHYTTVEHQSAHQPPCCRCHPFVSVFNTARMLNSNCVVCWRPQHFFLQMKADVTIGLDLLEIRWVG